MASSTLLPKIQRKIMLPPRCTIEPCMNMAVKSVATSLGPPGAVRHGVWSVSSHGMAAYWGTFHSPPRPSRGRPSRPSWRKNHTKQLAARSEEHTSELQSRQYLVCRLLLEKKKKKINYLSLRQSEYI